MRFETRDKIEEFFVDGVNADVIFDLVERTDYYFMYRILHSHSVLEDGRSVYLADLADELEMPVIELSKARMSLLPVRRRSSWQIRRS